MLMPMLSVLVVVLVLFMLSMCACVREHDRGFVLFCFVCLVPCGQGSILFAYTCTYLDKRSIVANMIICLYSQGHEIEQLIRYPLALDYIVNKKVTYACIRRQSNHHSMHVKHLNFCYVHTFRTTIQLATRSWVQLGFGYIVWCFLVSWSTCCVVVGVPASAFQ